MTVLLLGGCGGGAGPGGGQSPDPVVLDVPIAYVKRPLPLDGQGILVDSDLRQLRTFNIGAELWLRDRAAPSSPEHNITERVTEGSGLYDIRDLEVSWDGSRVVFAMRGPFIEGADEEDQPTWNIWEYDITTDVLRRIIAADLTAEAGNDVAPSYLPDGRILFSSTRQRQSRAVLLDEGKPQFDAQDEDRREPAFVLHVMNPEDGSDIRQISFNQSHDLDPIVLADGRVMFTRWDHAGGRNGMHLYRMNPDGTGLELLYGARSHATGTDGASVQFSQPRELPDGRVLTLVRPFVSPEWGGDLVAIDTANFVENLQAVAGSGLSGPAQERAIINDVRTGGGISPGGRFNGVYPLWDGTSRAFVSWSPCRLALPDERIVPCTEAALADPAAMEAPPLYGIWVFDVAADTQLPVFQAEEGMLIGDVVAAQPRTLPPIIYDKADAGEFDPVLVAEGAGFIDIRSVYDVDGVATLDIATLADPAAFTADGRSARFLRLEKAVPLPDDDVLDFRNSAFGEAGNQRMREILGYVPVEPDGSVVAKVPANVPLAISVLDRNGRRITHRHQNWLQVRPGQVLRCNGCHEADSMVSHGRQDAFESAWAGAPADAQPFPNTDPAFFADFGETMAQVKARVSCAADCALVTPSMDVVYEDIWTDEIAAGRPRDASVEYRYADLGTPPPTTAACMETWSPLCRSIINYETHIHPLWALPRQEFDDDGITVLADHTCTTCHSPVDGMGMAQLPAEQLDLGDGPSDINADHFKAYRELVSADNQQELADGALRDVLVEVGIDPVTMDPIFAPVTVSPPMRVAGANASVRFFSRFGPGGTHEGWLSPAELRLLSEWLDIGGQYYNNPFDAPLD